MHLLGLDRERLITPLAKAIGHRIEMDGPVDSEMAFAGFTALAGLVEAYYTGGVSWYLFRQSIADALVYMGNSHTTAYYHYGLLVRELGSGLFDGDVVWDIYEFSLE